MRASLVTILVLVFLFAVIVLIAWRRRHPRPFPASMAALLHSPLRRLTLDADAVAKQLELAPGMWVLEIGPGSGYVTRRVASRMGANGLLVGLDIQLDMLRELRARIGSASPALVCASGSALPFRNGKFDRVFLVSVLGEIPDKESALGEYARVLGSRGLLAVTESIYDPDYVRLATLKAIAERAGFAPGNRGGTWAQYTQCFVRR